MSTPMPPWRWWQVRRVLGALRADPVRRHGQVVGRLEPRADPPGGVLGGEVDGARGDVDVGDLHGHGLELRQRPAELGAALDVVGGQVARSGDQAGGGERQPGDGVLDQDPRGALAEQLGGRAVEDDGVLGLAAGRRARQQRDAGIRGIDQATTASPSATAVTSRRAACSAYVTPTLRPVTLPSTNTWCPACRRCRRPAPAGPGSAAPRRRRSWAARPAAARRCRRRPG